MSKIEGEAGCFQHLYRRHIPALLAGYVFGIALKLMMCSSSSFYRAILSCIFMVTLYGLPVSAMDARPGRVFLTFDDGPIDVTLDVLDALKTQGIKATFFVNAIHLERRGGENEDRAREALHRIITEGHLLGNHSHNHMAHNRPPGAYSITAADAYSDLESDLVFFVPSNVAVVNESLGELAMHPNNRVATLARLPYSNVWVVRRLGEICKWCDAGMGPLWHPDAVANSAREVSAAGGQLAVALYQRHGMESFGWDVHWQPRSWSSPTSNETLPAAAVVEREIVALLTNGIYCASTSVPRRCKSPVRERNVIVLVHDFLFENGSRGRGKDVNLPQLIELIASLRRQGYVFSTLDRYLD